MKFFTQQCETKYPYINNKKTALRQFIIKERGIMNLFSTQTANISCVVEFYFLKNLNFHKN